MDLFQSKFQDLDQVQVLDPVPDLVPDLGLHLVLDLVLDLVLPGWSWS